MQKEVIIHTHKKRLGSTFQEPTNSNFTRARVACVLDVRVVDRHRLLQCVQSLACEHIDEVRVLGAHRLRPPALQRLEVFERQLARRVVERVELDLRASEVRGEVARR